MDCIFCSIVNGNLPADKVYEDDTVFAFLDIKPVNPGHTLLIPKEHSTELLEATNDARHALVDALPRIAKAVKVASGADGFNIGVNNGAAAGQIIFHTHMHIIPRFSEDGYKSWGQKEYGDGEAAAMAEKIKAALQKS